MDYKPKLPEHNVNVSHEHPLREFFTLLAAAIGVFLALVATAGLLVDKAVDYIDPELEAELFASSPDDYGFAVEAPSVAGIAMQSLMDELRMCMNMPYPITLSIESSETVNAMAFPGGHVVVFSGLVDVMSSENGLAFVLAHELAHFKHRDHLRGMGRALVYVAAATLVSGANSGLTSMLTPAFSLDSASYSQDRESAADAAALEALNCHYGDVAGATELFQYLDALDDDDDWPGIHYFSTHPEVEERIEAINALAYERQFQSGLRPLIACPFCGG